MTTCSLPTFTAWVMADFTKVYCSVNSNSRFSWIKRTPANIQHKRKHHPQLTFHLQHSAHEGAKCKDPGIERKLICDTAGQVWELTLKFKLFIL